MVQGNISIALKHRVCKSKIDHDIICDIQSPTPSLFEL